MHRSTILAALVLTASASLLSCGDGDVTAYVGATVFDGSGAPPILDANIIVVGGHIEQVGSPDMVKVPRGALEIRLDGKWVIPGLVDAHVHVARWTLSRYLAHGVTSVRSMGGAADTVVALRDHVLLGGLLGPRLFISGPMVDGVPATWGSATVAEDQTGARRAVDQLVLFEVSHIKAYSKLDRELLTALIDEANAFELPVAAHLGRVDALTAARLGIASIEHMSGVVEATLENPGALLSAHSDFFRGWNAFERGWTRLDSASLERTAAGLAEAGVAIVPTLTLHEAFGHLSDQQFTSQLDLSGVPQWVRDEWDVPDLIRRARLTSSDFRAFRSARPAQDLFLRRFRSAGGRVIAGSDSPNQLLAPGVSLHHELELLVRAGLTPEQALLAATRDAAELLEADSIGTILPGNVADFVVLDRNPLEDISNVRLIDRVVYRGVGYRPDHFKSEW
jgi:imidazolonepropionase-like amidohydrolase